MVKLNKNENATLIVEFSNSKNIDTVFNQVINVTEGIVSQGSFCISNNTDEVIVWNWDGQKITHLDSYIIDKLEDGDNIYNQHPNLDFYLRVVDIHRLDFVKEVEIQSSPNNELLNILDLLQENNLNVDDLSNYVFNVFVQSDLNDNSKKVPYQSTLTFELSRDLINKFATQTLGLVMPNENNKTIVKKETIITHFSRNESSNGELHEIMMHFNDQHLNNIGKLGLKIQKIVVSKQENTNKLVSGVNLTTPSLTIDINNSSVLNKKLIVKTSIEHVTNQPTNEYGEAVFISTNYHTIDLRHLINAPHFEQIFEVPNNYEIKISVSVEQNKLTITKEIYNQRSQTFTSSDVSFLDLEIMNVLEQEDISTTTTPSSGINTNESLVGHVANKLTTLEKETVCFDLENRLAPSPKLSFNASRLFNSYPLYLCKPVDIKQTIESGFSKYIDKNQVVFQYKRYDRTFTLNIGPNTSTTFFDGANQIKNLYKINHGENDYSWKTIKFNSTLPNDKFEYGLTIINFDSKEVNPKYHEWFDMLHINQMRLPKLEEVRGSDVSKHALINSMIRTIRLDPNNQTPVYPQSFGTWVHPTNSNAYFELRNSNSDINYPFKLLLMNNNLVEMRAGRHGDQSFNGFTHYQIWDNSYNHQQQIMGPNIKVLDVNTSFEVKKRKVIVFKPNIYIDVYEDTNLQEKSILKLIPLKEYIATQIKDDLWQIHSKNLQDYKYVYTNLNLCSLNYIKVLRKDDEVNHFNNVNNKCFVAEKGNENNTEFTQVFENSGIIIYANEDIDVYESCYANATKANFKLEQDHKYFATQVDVGTLYVCKMNKTTMQSGYIKFEDKDKYIVEEK